MCDTWYMMSLDTVVTVMLVPRSEECVTPEDDVQNIGKGECILPPIAITDVAEN